MQRKYRVLIELGNSTRPGSLAAVMDDTEAGQRVVLGNSEKVAARIAYLHNLPETGPRTLRIVGDDESTSFGGKLTFSEVDDIRTRLQQYNLQGKNTSITFRL